MDALWKTISPKTIGCAFDFRLETYCRTHRRSGMICMNVVHALQGLALENRYPPPADVDSDEAMQLRQDALTV